MADFLFMMNVSLSRAGGREDRCFPRSQGNPTPHEESSLRATSVLGEISQRNFRFQEFLLKLILPRYLRAKFQDYGLHPLNTLESTEETDAGLSDIKVG